MLSLCRQTDGWTDSRGMKMNNISYLIFLKQRSANITIQGVCKVMIQVVQSLLQVLRFLCIVYRQAKQIDKPHEGVLVHRLNVCQVGNRKEENGGVDSDRLVSHTGCVNLFLCLFSNSLGKKKNTRYDYL